METNYFSKNGELVEFNFDPFSTIWLKDVFYNVYEEYLYTYDMTSDKPFKFKVVKDEESIMEIGKFEFETQKEGIETLIKYHSPKLTEHGEITIESVCKFSTNPEHYIYNITKYPNAFVIDINDLFVSEHKYSRDLDPTLDYDNLPPICVKYTNEPGYLYEILDGYHRTKYSKLKNLSKIPVILY